jgi:hypothetical protein
MEDATFAGDRASVIVELTNLLARAKLGEIDGVYVIETSGEGNAVHRICGSFVGQIPELTWQLSTGIKRASERALQEKGWVPR